LKGGRVKECFCVIPGSDVEAVLVCEGFATGASLQQVTGHKVLCAMNAGNLQSVAYTAGFISEGRVKLCADNDHQTAGNPGIFKARLAARATGADLTWPPFCGESCVCTDFNDAFNCSHAAKWGGV
ncbi:toprim domain-containing protein, partial [Marinobacter sp.]